MLDRFLADPAHVASIAAAAELIAASLQAGGKVLTCGNGGSLCDAQHFAEELSGRYRQNRRALAAIALTEASHMTCVANDFGFEFVFSRFVEALGRPGDVLLAISTSGNSPNILRAAEAARELGMTRGVPHRQGRRPARRPERRGDSGAALVATPTGFRKSTSRPFTS